MRHLFVIVSERPLCRLKLTHTWRKPRQLMPSQPNLIKRKPSLTAPISQRSSASESTLVVLRVVWNIELIAWVLSEPTVVIPRHVLDGKQRAVCGEQDVQIAGPNDDVIRVLNHSLQYTVCRRCRATVGNALIVIAAAKDVPVSTALPIRADGRMDGGLDVRAIPVDLSTGRECGGDVR